MAEFGSDLAELIARDAEGRDLDYKGPGPWTNDTAQRCELVKDVLAFANTAGGFVVIGVTETATGFDPVGLGPSELATWETTRFNQFLQNYSSPPINTQMRKAMYDGKWFVTIEVPQFEDVPHICKKAFPGVLSSPTIYVRTANNESAPVNDVTDLQRMVEQAVRNRRDSIMVAVRSALFGASMATVPSDRARFEEQAEQSAQMAGAADPYGADDFKGHFTTVFYPGRFSLDRFDPKDLRAAAAAQTSYRGWPFIFIDAEDTAYVAEGVRTLAVFNDFRGNKRFDYWLLRRSGLFLQRRLLWEESEGIRTASNRKAIDPNTIIFHVAESILGLTGLYEALDLVDEEVTWRLTLTGALDRELHSPDPGRLVWRGRVSRSDTIDVSATHSIEEWRAGGVDFMVEAIQQIFLQFQWDDADGSMIRGWIDRMVQRRL